MFQDHEGTIVQDRSLKEEKNGEKEDQKREEEHIEETTDVAEGGNKEGE
jgi:hypothetical protein